MKATTTVHSQRRLRKACQPSAMSVKSEVRLVRTRGADLQPRPGERGRQEGDSVDGDHGRGSEHRDADTGDRRPDERGGVGADPEEGVALLQQIPGERLRHEGRS